MTDYNIHIHLPDDEKPQAGKPMQEAPQNKLGKWLDGFVKRIKYCHDWKSLYELSEDFRKVGLVLKDTSGNRKVLCRVDEGKPVVDKIVDDYIFVGSSDQLDEEVSQRALEVILYFVEQKATSPQVVSDSSQKYTQDMALYGKPLMIYSESAQVANQEVETMGRLLNG